MSADYIIRTALPEDASSIALLYHQLVDNPAINVQSDRIAQISADSHTKLYVCEMAGIVIGTALVSLCCDAMFGNQPFAVVENVVVDAACRDQGIGSAIFQKIQQFSLENDCSKIMLLSSVQRTDAHRFFERNGFSASSKRGFVKYRSAFSKPSK